VRGALGFNYGSSMGQRKGGSDGRTQQSISVFWLFIQIVGAGSTVVRGSHTNRVVSPVVGTSHGRNGTGILIQCDYILQQQNKTN
jgi:hypothetical protein